MAGRYTREGDVRPLLRATDDMFVISRPGDEIALSFDAAALPPLPAGLDADVPALRRRLQQGDGHPLGEPGHRRAAAVPRDDAAIRTRPDEHYPRTQAHREYLARYNTRDRDSVVPS